MKKSFPFHLAFSLVFLLCLFMDCKKAEKREAEEAMAAVDLEAAKAAVHLALNQMIESYETENIDLFSRIIAHDPDIILFGTDASEKLQTVCLQGEKVYS